MIDLSELAPVTDAERYGDLATYLQNGGKFYLPAEAAALLIAAALIAAAAVIFLISNAKKKKP